MKILYKNMGFGGGAPRSLLQYVKIAKKNKIEVVVVGQQTYDPKNYRLFNISLLNLPYFKLNKPLYSFILLNKYLKIIRNEKPNIIHATTTVNCYFHKVVSDLTNIPIIYNIPGGQISKQTAKIMNNKKILVYSEENKIDLMKYGHEEDKINVISNRIDTSKSNDEYKSKYNLIHKKNFLIKILLISRFSEGNIKSIKYTIELITKLKKDGINVRLDILGDGEHYEKVNQKVEKLNRSFKENIVYLHGFVDDPTKYIIKSHIVFGKGRSVIDGILNNRLAFVVTENKTMCLCNENNFENLRRYNFTGRELKVIFTYKEMLKLIKSLSKNNFNIDFLPEFKEKTKKFYDIKFAEEKIIKLYRNVNFTSVNYKPKFVFILIKYIKFYIRIISTKIML